MGAAIGMGHLDASSLAVTGLIDWLRHLFHDSAAGGA